MSTKENWEALRRECAGCRGCPLGETRTKLVFGDGNPESEIMLIGEGPGEQEDLQGIPFVGPAGKLLDSMLQMIDLDRSRVYIANMVKCRPPHNRDPQPSEQQACRAWLDRQIELVDPKCVITLGNVPLRALTDRARTVGEAHGQFEDWEGRLLFPMYHPASVIYNPSLKAVYSRDIDVFAQWYQNL